MVEWEPGAAAGVLFFACVVLAGWAVLWLLEGWELRGRERGWATLIAVAAAAVVLLSSAVCLAVFAG